MRRRQKVTASECGDAENSAGRRQGRNFFPFARSFVVHAILLSAEFTRVNLATMNKGLNRCSESAFTISARTKR
jgi:hypothetical protein